MHFDALLETGFFTGAAFSVSAFFAAALALTEVFFSDAGLPAALSEQFLFEQRLSITNEPHSQNSANKITPFVFSLVLYLKNDIIIRGCCNYRHIFDKYQASPENECRRTPMFKKKILIIDDTELMVKLTRDILTENGFEVVSANNGMDGIRMVMTEKPDLVLLDIVMPGIDGFEVCKILRQDESNNLMPIIMLTAQGNEEDKLAGLELGADDYITKPFNPRELISRVKNTLLRIERNRWANPLTGLPGNTEIQSEINYRIANEMLFSVLYLDVDNFKAYNDAYGFARGDTAIKLIADILMDTVSAFGSQNDFIGHIGGDDFVVITSPECADVICENIIKEFDERVPELYSETDRKAGFISTTNRKGYIIRYPIMTLSIAVTSNEFRVLQNHIQVGEIAAELKKKAKSITGSVYLKDMRKQKQ